ncbi:hypothetical protein [Microbacterium sp.]|uniref:hypothetical protein n=1 Tax=Microbacterium sp. TaxID=51671 RepID=UPI0039E287C5
MRRLLVIAVALAAVTGAGAAARSGALDAERADVVAELRTMHASIDEAARRGDYLTGAIEVAEKEVQARDDVLEVRPGFAAEIAALRVALDRAQGHVDTSADRAAALSAQEAVLAERADPAVVANATATVHALAAKIDGDVASWAAAQRVRPGGQAWASSGPDGYARVRAALDRVGGAGIGLYESGSCAGGNTPACASSDGYIKYRADIAEWGEGRLNWAMAHELAHIYQFQVWGALNSSAAYDSMFGHDPEYLANCMAVVRGFPGSVGCDGDQQEWASGIWVGAVR